MTTNLAERNEIEILRLLACESALRELMPEALKQIGWDGYFETCKCSSCAKWTVIISAAKKALTKCPTN